MNHVIMANHMISLITSSTTENYTKNQYMNIKNFRMSLVS